MTQIAFLAFGKHSLIPFLLEQKHPFWGGWYNILFNNLSLD